MKKFTVILLYPDYVAENYGQETYMTCVEARTPKSAVNKARRQVIDGAEKDEYTDADDLFVIAVIAGDHRDLNPYR